MPYLILKGAIKFIDFAMEVFNAELNLSKMREDNETLMHAELNIGGSTIMLCDATFDWKAATGNLFIYVNNADETYHKAIKAGAKSVLELKDESYGRTCGICDPFGNVWWITSLKINS